MRTKDPTKRDSIKTLNTLTETQYKNTINKLTKIYNCKQITANTFLENTTVTKKNQGWYQIHFQPEEKLQKQNKSLNRHNKTGSYTKVNIETIAKDVNNKDPPNNVNCKDRSSHRRCSVRKVFACNFIKKESLAQVFSCEFCEISKNTFLTEHLRATTSAKTILQTPFSSRSLCQLSMK